jgi:hypothetical protein
MEDTVKERLKLFLKESEIKGIDFCRTIKVSSGFISGMRESIQPDKLKSIAINYPSLNITWLLTGVGEMGTGISKELKLSIDKEERLLSIIESQQRMIESQQKIIESLQNEKRKAVALEGDRADFAAAGGSDVE